jgi:prolyl 4-hydroxylase
LHERAGQAKEKAARRGLGATIDRAGFAAPAAAVMDAGMANPGETTGAVLLAQPGVRRVPCPRIELFDRPGFLPAELCDGLIALIDQDRRPSTIADPNGDAAFRTSETCDLDPAEPAVRELEARLLALNGIDPAHGEPVQGQRYAVGQEFKAHTDYFDPKGADYDRFCAETGNRTWTFMIYLNEPTAGGATRFLKVNKIIQPERGKLLAWNNRLPDGRPNGATIHHGMKVRAGVKYIITKWYRERPSG